MTNLDVDGDIDLTPTQIEVIELLEERPRSIREIAEEIGVTKDAIHSRIEFARKRGAEIHYSHAENAYYVEDVPIASESGPDSESSASDPDTGSTTTQTQQADDDDEELTDREKYVLSQLPASSDDLASALDTVPSDVEHTLDVIEAKGVEIDFDRDAQQWFIADERSRTLRDLSTKDKTAITREAREIIKDERATLLRRLRRTEPLSAPPVERDGHETFCAILGDLHFGDLVEKEYWDQEKGEYCTQTVYSSEIAAEKVATFTRKLLNIRNLMESVTTFDDAVLFLLGDIATGMHVYDGQWQHIDKPLKNQTEESVGALYQLVVTLAEEFETVQVRGIPGNHGTDKASSAIGANTDLITYSWLDDRLRDSGYDNIDFRTTETHHYLNTVVRGWRFHVRHGDDELEHVDETAASARDWRGLVDEFDFHAAMKGHHHKPAYHKIMNRYPVFSAPSPKPGSAFASKIGKPDTSRHSDLGWCFGVSDTRCVTWQYLLDDR